MRSLSIDFKRKSFRRCFTLLLASLSASTLCAQDNTDTDKARQLDSVTVVSNKLSPNVTSTMPMQQLLRSELQALGILNLSDAVKKFAGAEVKDYGGIGGMKTVSVRNLGAHHTAVSYDGITISNTQAGQIDIGRYTLDNAESVSLAVGSDDNLLQSARHLASGAILSITSERHAPEGERMEMKIKGGSFGMVSPSFRLWQPISQHTAVTANASFMRADGNYPFKLVNGIEKTTEKRYNSDIYSWQAEANLFHTWRDNSQLDIKAYWYYSQRGLPGAVILYNKKSDERLWDEDFFTQAVYTKRFNNRWSMKARLKYSHSWNKYEDTDVKYENGKRIDVARQNEYYGSVAAQWKPTEWLSLALAEDLFFNNLRSNISISDNLTDPPYPKRTTSLTALSAQVQVQRLKINGNIVATYASESVKAGSQPADKKRLSPSLSASYRLLNDQSLFLRAMYKSTFRMPTFNDLYYIRMGNTGLKPENAHELNAGITYSGRPVRFLKYVTLTVDAYLNNIDDNLCMENVELRKGENLRLRHNFGNGNTYCQQCRRRVQHDSDGCIYQPESRRQGRGFAFLQRAAAIHAAPERQPVGTAAHSVRQHRLQPALAGRALEQRAENTSVSAEGLLGTQHNTVEGVQDEALQAQSASNDAQFHQRTVRHH